MLVVVCFIVIVITALTLYMAFLRILEPLLTNKFRRSNVVHMRDTSNNSASMNDTCGDVSSIRNRKGNHIEHLRLDTCSSDDSSEFVRNSNKVSDVVSRARDHQKKWIGAVEAQRARVFDEHSILS
ncbi:hypothetical protein Ciccas_009309 [Cichlidogyrus casuarinus]|uniref:Uncharacterized protein n=1 Tax=Cichlidogyrus casuarinus TaxID=1844966 RepID=A0ABD2Q056_9PLAT